METPGIGNKTFTIKFDKKWLTNIDVFNPTITGKVLKVYSDSFTKETIMKCILGNTINYIPVTDNFLKSLEPWVKN